ncbi:hypothetical protein KAJ27_13810 [bacterium]|nr:hypothetical protein [bacterium]
MKKQINYFAGILGSFAWALFFVSCDSGIISQPAPNMLPNTTLFIQADSSGIDTTFSTQFLNWWGVDSDGEVMGYYYQWSYLAAEYPDSFIWTTAESDTFNLPIRQDVDDFWFKVKAVDNTAEWDYPKATLSQTDGEYFTDIGIEEKIYDSLDVLLDEGYNPGIQTQYGALLTTLRGDKFYNLLPTDTVGAVDKTPAYASFPIKNSPPSVSFVYSSNPIDTMKVESFTIRSFYWLGIDPDGNESITQFYYSLLPKTAAAPESLDDFAVGSYSGNLEYEENSITFRNIPAGEWVFYLVAEDIAGQLSPIIQFPKSSGTWTVIEPPLNGSLFIDDYGFSTVGDELYPTILDSLIGKDQYAVWDIEQALPYSKIDIQETFNLFDYIIYYADGSSQLALLSNEILSYISKPNANNHILISSITASDNDDVLFPFLSSDILNLVESSYPFKASSDYRINPGQVIYSRDTNYVDVQVTPGKIISNPDGLILGADADTLYQLPVSTRGDWVGEPVIGLKYPQNAPAKLIFLSFTLHSTNGYNNLTEIFREFLQK